MEQSAIEPKSKFENTSKGIIGVVKLDLEGKPQGVPVPYKGQVWLSEKEEILTANAPRNEKDNPFANGSLTLVVASDQVEHERPIGSRAGQTTPAAEVPPTPLVQPAPPAAEEPPPQKPADVTPEVAPPVREAGASVVGTDEHQPQTRQKQTVAAAQPTPEVAAAQAEAQPAAPAAPAAASVAAQAQAAAKAKPGPLSSGSPSGQVPAPDARPEPGAAGDTPAAAE